MIIFPTPSFYPEQTVRSTDILPFCERRQIQGSFCALAYSHLLCRVAGSISFIMTIKPALLLFTSPCTDCRQAAALPRSYPLSFIHLPEAVLPDDLVFVSIIDLQMHCVVKRPILRFTF